MAKKNLFTKLDEFKKRTKFNQHLDLDDRDNIILSMIQRNPEISQDEIAQVIKLSQPSVGARIKKLHQKGILHTINGVNFRVINLNLAKVDINATDTTAVINELRNCPFFVNALITSGRHNLCLFLAATDLKDLEGIVNYHLRNNPKVKEIEMNVIISSAKDFIHPLNVDFENNKQTCCGFRCMEPASEEENKE